MKTHGYINRTTREQFRKAHIQVTHTLLFSDLVKALSFVMVDGDDDEITKAQAEKAIRTLLAEKGTDLLIDSEVDDDEIRESAEEHARRWWGSDFGST